MRTSKTAFTLVEIMIVIAIICILAIIAVPSYVRTRASTWKNECLHAQGVLRDAIFQYSLSEKKADVDPIEIADKAIILKGLKPDRMPCCPIRNPPFEWPKTFGDDVVCPVPLSGHDLPDKHYLAGG